ncbi:sporulation protein [Bacillus massiliigorillae]|uniref:sporulation protein n=1 Tax=Bacillus massiliigorillae TaxID=1243664 RepID=UPI0003A3FFBC|nr:sporulation protein [Bacillus massiliigorillae]
MWKKFMSSIGLGNIMVDTILDHKQYRRGESMNGIVHIKGGAAEQVIDEIVLTLVLKYEQDREDSDFSYHEKTLHEIILKDIHHVDSNEYCSIPFSIDILDNHPITEKGVETILRTKIIVPQAVDPEDEDQVIIV